MYLVTIHAYHTWREDHPNGYIQRGDGLRAPSLHLADWRAAHARGPALRFTAAQQSLLHDTAASVTAEENLRLHAACTTPTHLHAVISFRSPACACGASAHCRRDCPARAHAEATVRRLERKLGQALAKAGRAAPTSPGAPACTGTKPRPWLSRGWDLTPIRERAHLTACSRTTSHATSPPRPARSASTRDRSQPARAAQKPRMYMRGYST